jgi:DNA-directed RNA polymerase specialized sigma24 family protein
MENDGRNFPATAWTALLQARDPAAPEAREAMETLCRAYWRPVFHYLRALGLDEPAAEDVAQGVLANFCTSGALERMDRSNGKLRHFLKAAARHALYNYRRDAAAARRGSGEAPLKIDEIPAAAQPSADAAPEAAFDGPWARTLFERALAGLAENYALRGKSALFDALKSALVATEDLQPYAEIGSTFEVTAQHIKIEVHRLRRRLATRLREEVAATLGPWSTPTDIEEEARHVITTLAYERRG